MGNVASFSPTIVMNIVSLPICFRPYHSAVASRECTFILETYFVFMRACLHEYGCCVCLVVEYERVLDSLELDLDGCKLTSRYWKLNQHHPL